MSTSRPPRAPRRVAIAIDLSGPYRHHYEIVAGAERYALVHGWEAEVVPVTLRSFAPRHGRAFSGVICRATREVIAAARAAKIPLVNVWLSSTVRTATTVAVDEAEAAGLAVKHLADRGFRQFALISLEQVRCAALFEDAFHERVQAAGGSSSQLRVRRDFDEGLKQVGRAQNEIAKWLARFEPPLAITGVTDMLARLAAVAAAQRGWKIPGEVAIVGSGNEPVVCLNVQPTLSSIDYGFERAGYRAAEVLGEMMDGQPAPAAPVLVPPLELVPRCSTDVFVADDPLLAAAMRYLCDHSHEPISVQDVVAVVPASLRSLERRFKKVVGRSIGEELERLRLERAKRLLASTEMSVKQVALRSGFGTDERLCKVFHRELHTTPGLYRKARNSPTAGQSNPLPLRKSKRAM